MQQQWQPIETAPRDGTEILAFEMDEYAKTDPTIFICSWGKFCEDWIETWGGRDDLNPTHWMPLPEPPK